MPNLRAAQPEGQGEPAAAIKRSCSETDEDRFWVKLHSKDPLYALLHFIFKGDDVFCFGILAIHDGQ